MPSRMKRRNQAKKIKERPAASYTHDHSGDIGWERLPVPMTIGVRTTPKGGGQGHLGVVKFLTFISNRGWSKPKGVVAI